MTFGNMEKHRSWRRCRCGMYHVYRCVYAPPSSFQVFEKVESELGIPALLDPEDMVSMKVPHRLSIITYISQYYNVLTNKSVEGVWNYVQYVNLCKPSLRCNYVCILSLLNMVLKNAICDFKKDTRDQSKWDTLSNTCAVCQKQVHLVQRHLVNEKLYHRSCFRCQECSSYKAGSEAGTLICNHHFSNHSNCPDLSRPGEPMMTLGGKAIKSETLSAAKSQEKTLPQGVVPVEPLISSEFAGEAELPEKNGQRNGSREEENEEREANKSTEMDDGRRNGEGCKERVRIREEDGEKEIIVTRNEKDDELKEGVERREMEDREGEKEGHRGTDENEEVKLKPLLTPSLSEHSSERYQQEDLEAKKQTGNSSKRCHFPVPVHHLGSGDQPVPAPRWATDSPSTLHPAPRTRPSKVTDSTKANGVPGNSSDLRRVCPALRERLLPTGSSGRPSGTYKRRDPPWMDLVEPGPWRRLPPAPPASLPRYSSVPCLWGRGSRLALSTNPFEAKNMDEESVQERACMEKPPPSYTPKPKAPGGPHPTQPSVSIHGFPNIKKKKMHSAHLVRVEDIQVEMRELERHLNLLELRGVELERNLRGCQSGEQEETLLVDWFTLIHQKHVMVRREAMLVYTEKQQNLEKRQANVEYDLRCLLNKPEREWINDDWIREQQLMAELVKIIEERDHIVNRMDQDKQRHVAEDKLLAAMIERR
ncbi:MICAL-like protein 1 [Anguilla rostrata]|uniref:MICAL-like protein 1 n=1 Tax=Anguilla rostrata TaxID=7938 RepID=UPI0030D3E729